MTHRLVVLTLSIALTLVIHVAWGPISRAQQQKTVDVTQLLKVKDAVSATVNATISAWQEQYGIKVSAEARRSIESGFGEQASLLQRTYSNQGLNGRDQQSFLVTSLVENYLFDVRDNKFARSQRKQAAGVQTDRRFAQSRGDSDVRMQLLRAKTQQSTWPLDQSLNEITGADVQAFPVPQFFLVIEKVLKSRSSGRLEVFSNPKEASITIDQEDKGLTCKIFVASAGDHDVTVVKEQGQLSCAGKVRVTAGKTERFSCPVGAPCPK